MTFDFDAEVNQIVDTLVDLDGFPSQHPWQCHDLWLWLLYKLGGRPGEGYAPGNGDTVNVFTSFPYKPRLAELFTKHDGTAGIRKGDILFWRRGVWFPGSHVAIADGPAVGELVPTITQNPGPVKRANLITRDLVGYLRPRALDTSTRKGIPMYDLYWTGPTVKNPHASGRLISVLGSFWVPNMQVYGLLMRRRDALLFAVRGQTSDDMLDAEHDIINGFMRTCLQAAMSGIALDQAKYLAAINDGFKQLGKNITITADTVDLDVEDLAAAFNIAAPRIAAALVKQAGVVMSK